MDRSEYVDTVLRLFAGDWCEDLWWSERNGEITFDVNCNDTFGWGCADGEVIEVEDLEALAQAKIDLPGSDWPLLWIARKRGERPMNRWMERYASGGRLKELLEAAGPPRESTVFAP